MNAVFFESHLLAIAIEQIHVIVIAFVHLWYKQNSSRKSNQLHRQLTDSHEIIYPGLGQRGQTPYTVQRRILL